MLFDSLFGRKNAASSTSSFKNVKLNRKNHHPRHVAFEPLEARDLLTVTTGNIDNDVYSEIRSAFPDFDLPELQSDLNVMTITPNDGAFSLAELKNAIEDAGNSTKPDLIIALTSDDANAITYTSNADELSININESQYGSVTIIGWGSQNLTLNANQMSRVMTISGSSTVVNLGGLTITGGNSLASSSNSNLGGGILVSYGTLTLSNTAISNNTAVSGGGILNWAELSIYDSVISGNSTSSSGGGITNNSTSPLTIVNSELCNNIASSFGGGIDNNLGLVSIINSTIYGNSASNGGGFNNNSNSVIEVANSTIYGNTADSSGDVIFNGPLNNWSGSTATFQATNSIILGSIRNDSYGVIVSYNNLSTSNDWWTDGHNNILYDSTQPLFVDAENNDFHLAEGAQAIDSGDNALAVDSSGLAFTFDKDRMKRISNGTVDIGAYEYNSSPIYPLVVDTLNDSFDLNDNEWSLREAIYYASDYESITFASELNGTITLTQGPLTIDKVLLIDGDERITIDANHNSRVISVTTGKPDDPVYLYGLTIKNGNADECGGGVGVFRNLDDVPSALMISNCTIEGNTAMSSGGIYNDYDCMLTVENSMISGNSATFCGGGISNEGFLTVTDCTIEGNSADGYGGGIEHSGGTAVISNSVIRANTVTGDLEFDLDPSNPNGAGIYIAADFEITNSLIVDNEVLGEFSAGAGIYGGYAIITNCTIAGNIASIGAGIYNFDEMTVNNSIILDDVYNEHFVGDNIEINAVLSGSNNLSTITDWANNYVYDSTQPLFVNAANGDYHLADVSQAIDKGNNDLAVDKYGYPLYNDLEGNMRIISDAVDIGAYEYSVYNSIYNSIRSKYQVFDLPESPHDINMIFVDLTAGDDLSDLKTAITTAGATEMQDIIIVITSDDANTLTYESADDELLININSTLYGAVTIVSWGDSNLTLDANQMSRVLKTNGASTVVNLGGLTITGGNSLASKSSTNYGGGIYHYYGTLTIANCSIVGNTSYYGGGIYNWDALTAVNTSIVGNTASYGGGILNNENICIVTNCTIAGNSAKSGGGINDYRDTLTLSNSIVSSNYASDSGSNILASNVDLSHNNLIGGYYGQFVNSPVFDLEGNLTNADTMDIHLRSNSIAVDAGDNSVASGLLDADGKDRFYGETVDIGAYEFQGDRVDEPIAYTPVVTTLNDSFDLNDNEWSLREAVYYAPEYVRITFADGLEGIIVLDQNFGQLEIDKALAIDGDGRITIDADHNSRVISVEAGTSETPVVLNGLTIQNGVSESDSSGGGISNIGVLVVSNCTVTGNTTSRQGGGIYNNNDLTVVNSYILRNSSSLGGGLFSSGNSYSSINSTMTILNSVISENTAVSGNNYYNGAGAGIYNSDGVLTITNTTIAGNSSDHTCGGLYSYNGELTLINNIISSNFDINDNSNISTLNAETSHNNLFGYYGLFVNDPVFDSEGNLTNADTMDLHLRSDSKAIDAGDNAAAAGIATDADGKARKFGSSVDIGAYEYQGDRNDEPIPYSHVVTTLDDSFDPNDGVWSLREAIYYAPEYLTITFADELNGTVTLTQGQLKINKSLVIDGKGRIVIDANQNSRVFMVDAGSIENPVILNGLTIQNGLTQGEEGAGIFNSSGVLTVSNCSILNNSSYAGAGIFSSNGNLTISNSVIRGNSAQYGAGILTTYDDLSITITTITNSVIVDNTAGSSGGGIYNESALTLTNCTIAHNFASYTKDGIINFGNITANNTIIADYILNQSIFDYDSIDEASISGSNNLSTFTAWASGENNIEYNPFEPLFIDEEGGDFHLSAGSQAIDKGDNDLAVYANNNAITFDLDGEERIGNDIVDIGAYEYKLDSSALLTPTFEDLSVDTEVTVTWSAVPNAVGYLFEYMSETDSDWTVIDVTENLSTPSASFNRNYELGYKFRVKALGVTEENNSAYSSTITLDPDYSVNYSRIREKYSDFDLPESEDDINIIVVDLTAGDTLADLKGAIATAGETPLPDLIVVCTSDNDNTLGYSSKTDELTISIDANQYGAVTIVSWGVEDFTLYAYRSSRVMTVSGSSTVVNLGGMTITGGNSANSASNSSFGGGILNLYSTITISDCTITNNTSSNYGGGIYDIYGEVTLINSEISNNTASTYGGGFYSYESSNLTMSDCTIINNTSKKYGGGLYSANSSTITMSDCTITDNTSNNYGGGLYIDNFSTITMTDCAISGNESDYGGGVYSASSSTIELIGCEISGNTSKTDGGGIYGGGSSKVTVTGGTVTENSANYGAGIYNASSKTMTVNNCQILENSASSSGGGFFNTQNSTLEVNGSLISGNTAANKGGGISNNYGAVTFNNNEITSNTSYNGGGISNGGSYNGESNYAEFTVINCVISDNSSTLGGGIYNDKSSTLVVTDNSKISGNSASSNGGGIYNNSSSTLTVTNSEISGNTATYGGGIYNNKNGFASITKSSIIGNATSSYGGGIYNYGYNSSSNILIADSVISRNKSYYGGGIYNYGYDGSAVIMLTNSEVSANTAIGANAYGGGICNSFAYLTITNCTIAGNYAQNYGSGICNSTSKSTFTAFNSIVSWNYKDNLDGSISSDSSNNLFGGYFPGFVCGPEFDSNGQLINFEAMDLHLRSDSLAIDLGDNSAASDIETDLDGHARIYGEAVDLGAYEYQGDRDDELIYSHVVNTLNDSFDLNDDEWSLREAVTYAQEYVTITFADELEGTIVLTMGQININAPLAINGDNRITLDAQNNSRIFFVSASDDETPVVLNGLSMHNGSGVSGGAIYNAGLLTVSNSDISGNASSNLGGAIFTDGQITITNCTIAGNTAQSGGGIYSNNQLTITNCTVAGNTAQYGGGINCGADTVEINNTIITSNFALYEGSNLYAFDYTINHSLIGYYGQFVSSPAFDSEGNLTNADTMDLHLRSDSKAINAGDNAAAAGIASDADGNDRIYKDTVDIGAYEYQFDRDDEPIPYSPVVTTLDDSFNPNDGVWSLREALYYAPEYVTIMFADELNGTVTLTNGQLVIDKPLAIDGDNRIVIDANLKNRVILIESGTSENPVALTGLTIQKGTDDAFGAGILNGGVLTIDNCLITENNITDGYGIGIYNIGDLTITNSSITSNYGAGEYSSGAGISNSGNLTIIGSSIKGNACSTNYSIGGGIENDGDMTIINSTIAENSAMNGGGICNYSTLSITNCTFAGNTASDDSAGICNYQELTVNNSIIVDGIFNEDYSSVSISGSNNLSTFTAWTSADNYEYDPAKPLFVNAAKGIYRLAKDSQAIDKGNNQLAYDAGLDESSTDLAHKPRFNGEAIDIGAYEFHESNSLDFVGVVSTQINDHDDTNTIPESSAQLTDWDQFYLELWAADVTVFAPGDMFETSINYNPNIHQLDTAQTISAPEGITVEITDQTVESDGTVTVFITVIASESGFTAPGSNTYLGSVLFTPNMAEGSGVGSAEMDSLGLSVGEVEVETALIAMPYDFDYDNLISVDDFVAFASVFGYSPSSFDVNDPRYAQTLQADFDGSGTVDSNDFVYFAMNFGLNKGSDKITLPAKANPSASGAALPKENESTYEEQEDILTPSSETQIVVAQTVATLEPTTEYLPAQPAQAESVQTLRQAHSSALLDLYDNQNEPEVAVELCAPAIDEALYQDEEFDFLFDDSDLDADDASDSSVDLSVVLDELELALN